MATSQQKGGRSSDSGTQRAKGRPDGARRVRRPANGETGSLGKSIKKVSPYEQGATGSSVGYRSSAPRRAHMRRKPAHAAHASPRVRERGAKFPLWGFLLVAIALVGVCAGGFLLLRGLVHPYEGAKVEDGKQVTVVIPEGSSGASIIQLLLEEGVIHSTADFRQAVS